MVILLGTVIFYTYNILGEWHDYHLSSYFSFLINCTGIFIFPTVGIFFYFRHQALRTHIDHILTSKNIGKDYTQIITFEGQGNNDRIWTAASASSQYFSSDEVPLEIRDMEGFESGIKDAALLYEVMEHFWKKDQVEITRFSRDGSLPTHGISHVGLYTMKDKRIGWFSIGPQEAANAIKGLDKGQVPNLFIITKWKGRVDFGKGDVELEAGMSVFIPQYMKHVIYNPYDEPLEGIIVLFGDNIDFARGKSYLDFLEQKHNFFASYDQSIQKKTN